MEESDRLPATADAEQEASQMTIDGHRIASARQRSLVGEDRGRVGPSALGQEAGHRDEFRCSIGTADEGRKDLPRAAFDLDAGGLSKEVGEPTRGPAALRLEPHG